MFFTIMLLFKIGLFIYLTKVEYNKALIFAVSGLITVFIFTLIYFSRNRRKNGIAIFFYCLISGVIFVDTVYYHYFKSLPSISMLKQINQLSEFGYSIQSIINPINIIFLIDIPFICLNYIGKRVRNKNKVIHYNKEARIGVPLGILTTIILVFTMINYRGYKTVITSHELYTYHIIDIINYFNQK